MLLIIFSRSVVWFFTSFFVVSSVYAVSESESDQEREKTNFEFGLGYGLLDEKSLVNIDFKINMPINDYLLTQVLLNSNYLITGSESDSVAQSELSSNWFIHNEYGRLGLGVGLNELEPMEESLDTEREVLGQFIGELFLGDFAFTTNYISNKVTFSNLTSSRVGMSYYVDKDQRISVYREKYSENKIGWRLETYFQPIKYRQIGSVGIIVRTGDEYDYIGVSLQYYFDNAVSLKERERLYH
ncbi:hypothetical protein [Marinomonas colpomeniae]|uniref:hypothetical protein n=1 Tax=Marinomonas colpomeniae TaxID=2774408 RepID=UPI0019D509B7|nr:hypothetical protein [Marinomonas colpomeniae]